MSSSQLKLAVCCTGLDISPSSPFHTSTLMGRMTGPTAGKNEKRVIRMQCSAEFKPGGRPASLLYDTFFESIVFEDTAILKSPFLASLQCSADSDCKVRVNVYYSSNLTSGKEVIIGATTFSFRELLRSGKGSFISDLISEHCTNAKATITVATVPDDPFDQFISLNETVPAVICDEVTREPAFPVSVPLAFLRNFFSSLQKSISSWEDRCKLERIRQGKFVSIAEAHQYGWHQLRITVLSSRIRTEGDILNTAVTELASADDAAADFAETSMPPMSPIRQSSVSGSSSVKARTASGDDVKSAKSTYNTYVDVLLENMSNIFLQRVGRTNTEYGTLEPRYGSSISRYGSGRNQKNSEFIAYEATEIFPQVAWGAGVHLGLDGYDGNVYHMMTYVPEVVGLNVRLDLYQDSGKSLHMGSCLIPLNPAFRTEVWAPVAMTQSYALCSGEILVQVEVISRDSNLATIGFCPAMPCALVPKSEWAFSFNEGSAVSPDKHLKSHLGISRDKNQLTDQLPSVIDSDDDEIPTVSGIKSEYHLSNDTAASLKCGTTDDVMSLNPAAVIRDCYRWLWDLGYTGVDPLVNASSKDELIDHQPAVGDGLELPRIDHLYELPWIAGHVKGLKEILKIVLFLITEYENMVERGVTIRKSPFKDNMEMQCLPLNLHFQFMVSRRHNTKSMLPEISDFTTCGAMSAHGLGYKNNGLVYQEDALSREKGAIENLLNQYRGQVGDRKALSPSTAVYELFKKIGNRAQAYESEVLRVGMRRLFCVSQILSIAVNTLLLKLNLVSLGYIDAYFASRWLDKGFPLIFESLLSVSGKEKVMLEDTSRAIDALRLFRARILCDNGTSSSDSHVMKRTRIEVRGREILIFLPSDFLERLPSGYHCRPQVPGNEVSLADGVVVSFVSFLFTLGIDIKQAMATTWENADSNSDLQGTINKRGFTLLNDYCHQVLPVDRFSEAFHPFLTDFETILRNPSKMNVDILHEVEKISVMLGGCRVTFCKSGKDRTGMAVTLDQSRQLSEIFGLENTNDRIIKDANLMREYGTRLMVAEKNIGRAVFAINRLQLQFMPPLYRPPPGVLEDVFKASDSS